MIERADNDEICFRVTAFSRPRSPIARLGGPITRWVQRRVTSAYLDGLHRFVTAQGRLTDP